jgi:hypothetical protein
MKDIFDGDDMSLLYREAEVVEDWPDKLQSLLDKGLIKVEYDANDKPTFSLTELGQRVCNEIDPRLN